MDICARYFGFFYHKASHFLFTLFELKFMFPCTPDKLCFGVKQSCQGLLGPIRLSSHAAVCFVICSCFHASDMGLESYMLILEMCCVFPAFYVPESFRVRHAWFKPSLLRPSKCLPDMPY
jgi:hypothetical protein